MSQNGNDRSIMITGQRSDRRYLQGDNNDKAKNY